jgi:23S rRNA (adenine2503-C2)-methyltransferase
MNVAPDLLLNRSQISGADNLVGLDRAALSDALASAGIRARELRMRTSQLWHWIYHRGISDFADMTNVSKQVRAMLAERFVLSHGDAVSEKISSDGTRKWLVRFADGNEVESVFIPEADRGTLCVSSQVGCTLNCKFCHTGTQRLVRNLTAAEIVSQIMIARDSLGEWPSANQDRQISNIVLMGMGEPLYNLDNVAQALNIVMDAEGISISRRRITLSTAGVVPMMARVGEELGVNLAISLHAVSDAVRDILVPINRKYPIAELLEACRSYPGLTNARRITFEYVMLKGINDSLEDAKTLVKLISGIPAKINLIPFNPWPGSPYECSDAETIDRFGDYVNRAGYASPVRAPRGRDIMAACGQLKSASEKMSRRQRESQISKAVS